MSSVALHGAAPGASDLPTTVFDRIVLSDAQSGETEDKHEEPGDPVPLTNISFLLKNVWIALLWMHFSLVTQEPRTIDMRAFRLEWFIVRIWEAIRASRGW